MPKCNQISVIKGNKAGFYEYESSSRVTQWVRFVRYVLITKVLGGLLLRKEVKLRLKDPAQ